MYFLRQVVVANQASKINTIKKITATPTKTFKNTYEQIRLITFGNYFYQTGDDCFAELTEVIQFFRFSKI